MNTVPRQPRPVSGNRQVQKKKSTETQQAQQRRRDAVKQSMRTKQQYDRLTLSWQEKLLSPVSIKSLQQAAQYMTPDDYASVVSERSSGHLCGYPICGRAARDTMQQQFHISLSRRKLFDVTEQKEYCSNRCMVGSRFFKQQLSSEPLYLRVQGKMDISVMPLEEEVKADELDQQLEQRVRAGTSERELVDWYMSSLFAKMKIPDSVSNENNPLTIVERDSGSAAMEMEVSDSMARLQFADVEGFEPAVDAARIKKAVKHAKRANEKSSRFLAARNALRKVDSVESMDVDSETPALPAKSVLNHMVRFDVSSEPQTEEELASDVLVPSDSESDTGTGYVASDDESDHNGSDSDDAMFSGMVGASGKSRSGEPSLSLFGRLWTLVDRLVTLQTRMFLHDLKGAQSVLGLVSSAAEYNSAPGDKSMATRHSLLVGSVEREYLDLQQELRTEMDLSHEIRLLVSSLALGQNTVVFARGELRLFVLVLVFVLARSMQNLAEALGRGDVAGRLDVILRRARTERSEMEMLARRFYEAY